MLKPFRIRPSIAQYNRFSYIYGMLYCSSECGSISIMRLRTIYCNTHVHTFHVCLCLLALTFVCNSTYLLKCSFQIYQKSIVVLVLEVQRYDSKQHDALKALSHGAIFLATCNAILLLRLLSTFAFFIRTCTYVKL